MATAALLARGSLLVVVLSQLLSQTTGKASFGCQGSTSTYVPPIPNHQIRPLSVLFRLQREA